MSELANLEPLTEAQSEQAYVMAIQGNLELFIVNHKNSNKYKLSINQISEIRSYHPHRARIYFRSPSFDPRTRSQDFGEWQDVNYKDIWTNQSKLTNPVQHNTSLSEAPHKLTTRSENCYQNIIGVLLQIIHGNAPNITKHQDFKNEKELIEYISTKYQGYNGLSESNLSRKFPEARNTLSNNE